ncbi:tyrosine-protein phosphatase non-receptor type 2 [Silurus meridionalis]|nr:tyrosine-protein phosphatase non-receptor type 2 [Silurus meridionalis]
MDHEFEDIDSEGRWQNLYIGPLRNTCGHFWLMIWEQKTKAVIMLNRVIEKGSEKCAQYWPTQEEREMAFRDTRFMVRLLSEDVKSYYTTRLLELQNVQTGEKREIYHFHYTTWPDFGVPESPASFLNFLFKVRESGSLGAEHGPAVVHCSAGIGRSGTFSLVDTCLVLMDKKKDSSHVDIKKVLLDMRRFRMGLIQTPDQLRFSYMAVLEGAKCIMGDSSVQKRWQELSNEDQVCVPESPSPPKCQSERFNGTRKNQADDTGEIEGAKKTSKDEREADGDTCTSNARKRQRDEKISAQKTSPKQTKPRANETEKKRKSIAVVDISKDKLKKFTGGKVEPHLHTLVGGVAIERERERPVTPNTSATRAGISRP